MSIIPINRPGIEREVRRAGVVQRGHAVLNSGRHSMVKIALDKIVEHPKALQAVHEGLRYTTRFLRSAGRVALLPVPEGAANIIWAMNAPDFQVLKPRKLESRQFRFDEWDKSLLAHLESAVIFEDVVTTGGTPAALAAEARLINPRLQLHLVAGWLRGEMLPEHARVFDTRSNLIDIRLEDWTPEACPHSAYHRQDVAG